MLLAILGPLLLIPITWVLYRFVVRPILSPLLRPRATDAGLRWLSLATAILVAIVTLAVSYIPGKREFDRLCAQHATPRITDQVVVEGFFRTKLFPYEANQFLDSFSFVEAPDPYQKGVNVRYVRDGGKVQRIEVPTLMSEYGVRKHFSELHSGITMTEKHIYELATNRELARGR